METQPPDVHFYALHGEFGPFSNFHPAAFELDGRRWRSVEQYFQAQKFDAPATRELYDLIHACDSPMKAKILGTQRLSGRFAAKWCVTRGGAGGAELLTAALARSAARGDRIRDDWEAVKVAVMRRAVRAKFAQNELLRALLLSTGARRIVEASPRDGFWGVGADGAGRNELGRVLMEVRAELSEPSEPSEPSEQARPSPSSDRENKNDTVTPVGSADGAQRASGGGPQRGRAHQQAP